MHKPRTHAQQAATIRERAEKLLVDLDTAGVWDYGRLLAIADRHIAAALAEQREQAKSRYIVRCHLCNATWVDGEVSSEFIAAHDRRCPGEMLSKVEKALRESRALPAPPAGVKK